MQSLDQRIITILRETSSLTIKQIQRFLEKRFNKKIKYKKLRNHLFNMRKKGSLKVLSGQQFSLIPPDELDNTEIPIVSSDSGIDLETWYAGATDPDIDFAIHKYGFRTQFSKRTMQETHLLAERVQSWHSIIKEQRPHRKDYTSQTTITIDPASAKDFDDAVSIERDGTQWRVSVHIADVTFFVPYEGAIYNEAEERGNSIYFLNYVIPMLPQLLTEKVCSLVQDEPRLAVSVELVYSDDGQLQHSEIHPGIIQVKRRLSYEDAEALIQAEPGSCNTDDQPIQEMLHNLYALTQKLYKRRREQGSLDLDLPDIQIIYDTVQRGKPIQIRPASRLVSYSVIEELMLAANCVVADVLVTKGKGLYRVHPSPDPVDLKAFFDMIHKLGVVQDSYKKLKRMKLVTVMEWIEKSSARRFLNYLLLRTLTKAYYTPDLDVHFALNFERYTHFTSPIRRYCDFLVHRLIKNYVSFPEQTHQISNVYIRKKPSRSSKDQGISARILRRIGRHISKTERIAEKAEREIIKRKSVFFMLDKIGNRYAGIISGVTEYGFYVSLDDFGIEGLVKLSSIPGYFRFDEENYYYLNKANQPVYRMGDHVNVIVARVSLSHYFIDLVLDTEAD